MTIDPSVLLQGTHNNAKIDMGIGFLAEPMQRKYAIDCTEEVLFAFTAPGLSILDDALALAKQAVATPYTLHLKSMHELCMQISRSHPNPSKDIAQAVACTVAEDISLTHAYKWAQGAWVTFQVLTDYTIKDRDARQKDLKKRLQVESLVYSGKQLERLRGMIRVAYQDAIHEAFVGNFPTLSIPLLSARSNVIRDQTVQDSLIVAATLIREQTRGYIAEVFACEPDEKIRAIAQRYCDEFVQEFSVTFWNFDRLRGARALLDKAALLRKKAPAPTPPPLPVGAPSLPLTTSADTK